MTTVAQFKIEYFRYLDENGKVCAALPDIAADKALMLDLYKNMVKARLFDKKAIALQRTGRMGTYAPINGQEAISTAIGQSMRRDDVFIPYYRDYAAQFQRGVQMDDIMSYWGGDERGSQFANNREDFPIAVPIASQCLHAAGVAFAFQYRNEARVAVVCIGDGGTSEGDFYEAINVAGTWNLPVVFVVNNNQWAISVPLAKQTACETLAQKAIAAGIEGLQIDGNDIIACREHIARAIEKARNGNGPTLIEAQTYRLCDHTTADDAGRYQPADEVETATLKEPVHRFRNYLESQSWWDEPQENALLEESMREVDAAVHRYSEKTPQSISSMFDYHYAELPDYLIEQRAMAMEESDNA
ncbi:MAG: pyruvate dehydrogenase (acetyl-transferring) E1 component subunit alpha [Legionellaceae bacterium]|nr:pyruvate dehydrogenase (acetyl-transferring) E1 component subunit alpha [Legionellaceae bacterium]